MTVKSHRCAVVAIPPESAWPPIQAIRREHDRQIDRWMPHVTLLYPFLSGRRLEEARPPLIRACAGVPAFRVRLGEFRRFRHARKSTVWLAPEPKAGFVRLQAALQRAFPEHDDVSRFRGGFTPHLSVGQTETPEDLMRDLRAAWSPLDYTQSNVAVLRRDGEGPFRVAYAVPLASPATPGT